MEDSADDVERKIRAAYCPVQPSAPSKSDDVNAATTTTTVTQDGVEVEEGIVTQGGVEVEKGTMTQDGVEVEAEDAGKVSMHFLTQDELKNPCLDYIQNIILSPPGSRLPPAMVPNTRNLIMSSRPFWTAQFPRTI